MRSANGPHSNPEPIMLSEEQREFVDDLRNVDLPEDAEPGTLEGDIQFTLSIIDTLEADNAALRAKLEEVRECLIDTGYCFFAPVYDKDGLIIEGHVRAPIEASHRMMDIYDSIHAVIKTCVSEGLIPKPGPESRYGT